MAPSDKNVATDAIAFMADLDRRFQLASGLTDRRNYSIFYCNDELFGYYECAKGVAYAEKVQAESPVVDRWNDYMKDILELEMDPVTGAQPKLEQVFRLD